MMGLGLSMAISRPPAASAGFTPLPGSAIDMNFATSQYYPTDISTLMDPTHTTALGALLTAMQGTDVSFLLQLKAIGSDPTGTTWVACGSFTNVFTALSDTTWRSRKVASSLTCTLGSGAFSTTACKLGFSANGTGRTGVGNNGTIVTDAQTWAASGTPGFINVDAQWNRFTVWTSRLSDAALAALTV